MSVATSNLTRASTVMPDSPPDLSSSKSSKSSGSFRSSILSDVTGPENALHFEDISLSEHKRDSYDLAKVRPQPRPLHSALGARRQMHHGSVDNLHSVHMSQRRHPPLRLNGILDDKSTNIPVGRSIRPGFRDPRSPPSQYSSSRSPSPNKSFGLQRSPASVPNNFLSVHGSNKKKAWAPGRKTTQQLEDEYHDSDEDVPEDAVIWNVPLTPLEPFTAASRDPSPRRRRSSNVSSMASPRLDRIPSAPTSAVLPPVASPRSLGLPRSATTGSFPETGGMFTLRERHQSWANDLGEDARYIAAALEAHSAGVSMDVKGSPASNPGSPHNYNLSRRQSNSSSVSLPPVQRSNIMIDPLPISKEKEAALARTRPSWLPPKCKKEEARHVKEWEKMMAQSVVADRRRAAQKLEEIETSRSTKVSSEKIWEERILPNWNSAIRDPAYRELRWQGIPSSVRGAVWKKAIGNDLGLTSASLPAALRRSQFLEPSVISKITADAHAVYPRTGLFGKGSPLHVPLVDICKAHASYRPDIGYRSDLVRITALLLLNMSESETFIALANLLSRPLPQAFLTDRRSEMEHWCAALGLLLQSHLPSLYTHLTSDKLAPISAAAPDTLAKPGSSGTAGSKPTPVRISDAQKLEAFIAPALGSLFTCTATSDEAASSTEDVDFVSRLWDLYLLEGDKFLLRAWVGLAARKESGLYAGSREEVLSALAGLLGGDVEKAIRAVREVGRKA